jgi:AcrR family transcriptional regulator
MGWREEKKQQQRRDILKAAVGLFRKRGYEATRVQDIIDTVGVSEATFFNYFPSKDALLEAYAIGRIEEYASLLRDEMADERRNVPDRVRDLVRTIGEALQREDRPFMALVATRSRLFQGGDGNVFERQVQAHGRLVELFREGQARDEIRRELDPHLLAESLTGAYTFAIVNWLTGRARGDELLATRLVRVADVVLEGCGTKKIARARRTPVTRNGTRSRVGRSTR